MKFISSVSNKDCLFQDLKMILAYFNKDKEYLFIPNPHLETPFTFQEIVDIARNYDMNLVGFQCLDINEILKIKKLPFIVTIKSKDRHAIIVEKIYRKKVKIVDPSTGVSYIKKEDLLNKLDGYGLYVSSFKKKKCPIKSIEALPKSEILVTAILEAISGISCLLGTYFVSPSYPFYLPIILFSVFFIFEILLRRYNVKVMEKMDERLLYSGYYVDNYFDYYQRFNVLKSSSLLLIMNLIISILISFFICYILIMNSTYNLINISVVIVFVIINFFTNKYYFSPKSREIAALENDIKTVKEKSEFVSLTRKANKEGYKYGLAYKLRRYVTIGFYLFTVILIMAISSSTPIDISYLIFNVVIMVLLDQYLTNLLTCDDHYEKYLDSKNYINQFLNR